MPEEPKYVTFNSDMGWVGILASARGLLGVTLPQRSAQEAHQPLGDSINQATWAPHLFDDLVKRLKAYFSGQKAVFPDELDLSRATSFQREVWEITRFIPYGETRSYLWVANQIKRPRAVRAVGQALSRNPLPIIVPCHRVVASDGKLGGFSGGVEMKLHLLDLEKTVSIR
ncbi:methylated-DNA--[protein]-cysteine S-methyltransferase [Chloroflexota bacterium]